MVTNESVQYIGFHVKCQKVKIFGFKFSFFNKTNCRQKKKKYVLETVHMIRCESFAIFNGIFVVCRMQGKS